MTTERFLTLLNATWVGLCFRMPRAHFVAMTLAGLLLVLPGIFAGAWFVDVSRLGWAVAGALAFLVNA